MFEVTGTGRSDDHAAPPPIMGPRLLDLRRGLVRGLK